LDLDAVFGQRPFGGVLGEVGESELVADGDLDAAGGRGRGALLAIGGRGVSGEVHHDHLVSLFDFPGLGHDLSVRHDETIADEGAIVGLIVVVAAVGVEPARLAIGAGFLIGELAEALVYPVPDTSAHVSGGGIEGVDILLEVADGVAHGVGVLAEEERLLGVLLALVDDVVDVRIHDAIDIGDFVVAFVVNGTGGVHGVDELGGGGEVHAGASLVSERPHDDAGVVSVAAHHAFGAIEVRLLPLRLVTQRLIPVVAHAVGLNVGFVHHVDAVLIAELIPVSVVHVVRATDGIDVEPLEELDVLLHALGGDVATGIGVVLMAVDAVDLDGLAIDLEDAVFPFDLSESDFTGADIDGLLVFVEEGNDGGVEIGVLGGPLLGVVYPDFEFGLALVPGGDGGDFLSSGIGAGTGFGLSEGDFFALGIEELDLYALRLRLGLAQVTNEGRDFEGSILVVGV